MRLRGKSNFKEAGQEALWYHLMESDKSIEGFERMAGKAHQIRLIGDPGFQRRLRETRGRLCILSKSKGSPADVARTAIRLVTPVQIKNMLDDACCMMDAPAAKPPDTVSINVSGDDADALKTLSGHLVSLGATPASLRATLHGAICVLSTLSDDELVKAASK